MVLLFNLYLHIIEGDAIGDKVEKISYEIKLVASPRGGSIIKSTSHYHCKGEVEIKEENVKAGKEKAAGLFKIIENHLLANPGLLCPVLFVIWCPFDIFPLFFPTKPGIVSACTLSDGEL
ncbi:hypothetical protein ACLB2K_042587 [Fragaria x ananassa]